MRSPNEQYKAALAAFAKRTERMRELRDKGWTLQAIATEFDVSVQRVHKILKKDEETT